MILVQWYVYLYSSYYLENKSLVKLKETRGQDNVLKFTLEVHDLAYQRKQIGYQRNAINEFFILKMYIL